MLAQKLKQEVPTATIRAWTKARIRRTWIGRHWMEMLGGGSGAGSTQVEGMAF